MSEKAKKKFIVARAMTGDQDYARGDEREMTEVDAAPLVALGALVLKDDANPVRQRQATSEAASPAAAKKAAAEKAGS